MANKKPTVKKKAPVKKPVAKAPEIQQVIKLDLGCGKRLENHLTRMSGSLILTAHNHSQNYRDKRLKKANIQILETPYTGIQF